MLSTQITADSTCDLPIEAIEKYSIVIQPLYIIQNDRSYQDGVNIHPEDIFSYVEESGTVPTTSATTIQDYLNLFTPFVQTGRSVVHCSISSALSSSYQNAVTAATMLREENHPGNVQVVDTKNLSTGSGLVVLEGCELAQRGIPAEEIAQTLVQEVVPRVDASFVIDKLLYLHKGGRCSAVAAFGANLLKLKPCIQVKNGEMAPVKKYRATFEKCVLQYVEEKLKGRKDLSLKRIFLTYTPCDPKLIEKVKKKILELQSFTEIIESTAGCTISSHCGPNTLGVLFMTQTP